MKKFSYKLLIFLSPFILVTLFFEVYLRCMNTQYKAKLDGLCKDSENIELLILGNSHANYGIVPSELSLKSYNMAMVNQPLLHDYKITEKVLPQLKNLKAVILCLDYHTLYFSDQGIRDNWVYYDYGIDTNVETSAKLSRFWVGYTPKISFSMLKYDAKRRWIKFRKHKPTLDFKVEDGVDITDTFTNGWVGYSSTNPKKFKIKVIKSRAATFNKNVLRKSERAKNLDLFKSYLNLLKQRHIKTYVITMPGYSKFNAMLDEKIRQNDITTIKNTIKGYDAEYIDFLDSIQPQKYFYDCDHLNKEGAVFFTKKLNKYIHLNNAKN